VRCFERHLKTAELYTQEVKDETIKWLSQKLGELEELGADDQ
jgi:hypothetical protein